MSRMLQHKPPTEPIMLHDLCCTLNCSSTYQPWTSLLQVLPVPLLLVRAVSTLQEPGWAPCQLQLNASALGGSCRRCEKQAKEERAAGFPSTLHSWKEILLLQVTPQLLSSIFNCFKYCLYKEGRHVITLPPDFTGKLYFLVSLILSTDLQKQLSFN